MRRILLALAFLAAAATTYPAPASAEGKAENVGAFVNADSEIDLFTYSEVDGQGIEQRVAVVKVSSGQGHNVAAFDASDWPTFVGLIQRAEASQSSTWHPIGEYVETGTSDVSHVRVSAGPGIRIVIESPAGGAYSAELPASRFTDFDASISTVSDFLNMQH